VAEPGGAVGLVEQVVLEVRAAAQPGAPVVPEARRAVALLAAAVLVRQGRGVVREQPAARLGVVAPARRGQGVARPEPGVARGRPPVVVGPGLAAQAPREALQVAGMAAAG
jgi:hypothetical protein